MRKSQAFAYFALATAFFIVIYILQTFLRSSSSRPKPPLSWLADNGVKEQFISEKWEFPLSLAIIMPVNNNTDMQFYQNTWMADHLFTVCDFAGPGCAMSCNEKSTWRALDRKTKCFTRAIKQVLASTEFFIKQDDDVLADQDYVQALMNKYRGHPDPLFISDILHHNDRINVFSLSGITHGNGKFYMFNRRLLDCVNVDVRYIGQRYEDTVFGGMIHTGCKDFNVTYVQEKNSKIWHRKYKNKNKDIDLAYIRNH